MLRGQKDYDTVGVNNSVKLQVRKYEYLVPTSLPPPLPWRPYALNQLP